MNTSLWFTIFAQGLLVSLLIYHAMKIVKQPDMVKWHEHFIVIIVLVAFSTVGWFVGQLMPDVLTACLILAVFNLTSGKNNVLTQFLYAAFIVFIVVSHSSHIPILILLLGALWLFIIIKRKQFSFKKIAQQGAIIIGVAFVISIVFLVQFNKKHFSRATISPSGNIFFFARLIDTDVIDDFLNDRCDDTAYEICLYKDSIPEFSQHFLWHTDGIFYKLGGWHHYNTEPGAIVKEILLSPKYYWTIITDFSVATYKQLLAFKVGGDFLNFVDGAWAPVYHKCLSSFPHDEMKDDFRFTRQAREDLNLEGLNIVLYVTVILSLLIILWALIRCRLNEKTMLFLFMILSGVLINAAVCANLSNVLNRYHARAVWLIPFLAVLLLFNVIVPEIRKKIKNNS